MNRPVLSVDYPPLAKRVLIALFTAVTLLGIFIPFRPAMPASELDPSWQYAMNEAVARHFSIGRQIIFTYGPYSSVSSRSYDPATDHLMILGGLVLGASYASLLLYLAKETRPLHLLAFLLYLAGFLSSGDALFFSYPLIAVACAAGFVERIGVSGGSRATPLRMLAAGLMIAPLGLVPLIKGTYLMLCGFAILSIVALLLSRRQTRLAITVLVCPVAAAVVFWKISGQSISILPEYFTSMSPIVAGFTEAMAREGKHKVEIALYLVPAAALLLSIAMTRRISPSARIFLAGYMAFFLLMAFKSGFVRHDEHAAIAGCSILLAAMITGMLYVDASLVIALALSFLAWFCIDKNHAKTSTTDVYNNLHNVYLGILERLPHLRRHLLRRQFEHALLGIRKDMPIPDLHGSVDVYPTYQAALLASNNMWDPRPVFQSYSAYTPALAALNASHLRGNAAPDNVLFSVDPIDMRLPSLEDGASWPAFLDNYTLTRFDRENDLAYLRRKPSLQPSSRFAVIKDGTYNANEYVAIPKMNVPIFAEIDLEPTFLGKLRGAVFKYPQLKMELRLVNGKTRGYRVSANMMQSGFFLSPLVKDTKGFTALMTGNPDYLHQNAVDSIMIMTRHGSGTLWKSTYALKLEAYLGKGTSE